MIKSRYFRIEHLVIFLILLVGFWIRSLPARNLGGALNGLDPYLFYRWAIYLEKYGKIPENDWMRYFPLGFDVRKETWILSVFLYSLGKLFGELYLAEVFYPPLMFLFGSFIIAYAITEFINKRAGIIFAIIISFLPGFIFRLSAGFADKEGLAYLCFSLHFYFLLRYFLKENRIEYAFYSGLFMGLLSMSWGGFRLFYIPLALTLLFKIREKKYKKFAIFFLPPFLYCFLFLIKKYGGIYAIYKTPTGIISLTVIFSILFDEILRKLNVKFSKNFRLLGYEIKITEFEIFLVGILIFSFIIFYNKFYWVFMRLFAKAENRFYYTVAENNPPYFSNWINNLTHLFIFSFILVPTFLYKRSKNPLLSILLGISLIFLVFTRYSTVYEKITFFDKIYWIPSIIFIILLYFYRKDDFLLLYLILFFLFDAVATRTAIRLFFVFSIPFSITVAISLEELKEFFKEYKIIKYLPHAIAIILLLPGIKASYLSGLGIIPTVSPIWVKTYEWIKNNTSPYSIVSHWWDYGYWTQFYADRITPVDGGNAYYIRNFYNARYFFCGRNLNETVKALEVLGYPDYILITSREPGVFTAIATIAYEDTNLGIFYLAQEKEGTLIYQASQVARIEYNLKKDDKVFPANYSYLAAVLLKDRPTGVVITGIYGGAVSSLFNISCFCTGGCKEYNGSLKGCFKIYPTLHFANGTLSMSFDLGIYIPKRVREFNFARIYILEENLTWIKKIYDNVFGVPFGNEIISCDDLCALSVRFERVPDLKVYKIDYREIGKELKKL